MEKTVVLPTWRESPAEALDAPNDSYATITDHETHRRVAFTGGLSTDGGLAEQVRAILARRREALRDFGGSMDRVVRTRDFVRADHLDRDAQARIREARDEFFDRPHHPASTTVATPPLLADDALVEIELDAEISDDSWAATVLTEEDA